jgi:hypothetical protein
MAVPLLFEVIYGPDDLNLLSGVLGNDALYFNGASFLSVRP